MNFKFKVGDIVRRIDNNSHRFITGIKVISNIQASYLFYMLDKPEIGYAQAVEPFESKHEKVN